MIIVTLEYPEQHEFLKHLFEAYSRSGMASSELPLAADTYVRVMEARNVPLDQDLGQVSLAGLGPKGIALEVPIPEGELPPRI